MKFARIMSVAAAAPLLVAAKPPVVLNPISPWVVDYSENSCRLVRSFGIKDNPVSATFETYDRWGGPSLLVTGKDLNFHDTKLYEASIVPLDKSIQQGGRPARTVSGKGALQFSDFAFEENERRKAPFVASGGPRPKSKAEVVAKRAETEAQRTQRLRAMTAIQFDTRDAPVQLATGPMAAAMAKMGECIENLETSWGLDPQIQKSVVWRPTMAEIYFDWGKIPKQTFNDRLAHQIQIRIKVDAAGRTSDCLAFSSGQEEHLFKPVCDVLMAQKFLAAETADGTKVPSYFTTGVRFQPY